MDGIHIPEDVARDQRVPEDLDSAAVGPYRFPDPRRRRIAGLIYLGLAMTSALALPGTTGRWVSVAVGLLLAAWNFGAAWPLAIEAEGALTKAAAEAPFPIGHASAAVTFHGWRSRPRWHVVVYDPGEPPSRRALIVLDGVSGEQTDQPFVEELSPAIGG
jgi:hypothetical protein